jgi:hypothetical protein
MLRVATLNVITLSVVMLSVGAPLYMAMQGYPWADCKTDGLQEGSMDRWADSPKDLQTCRHRDQDVRKKF